LFLFPRLESPVMNKLVCAFLVCCLSMCVAAQWTDSSWTDTEYGGVMYLCFEGQGVSGSYSQYGVLRGERDGLRVEGNWYEVGPGDCDNGNFVWNLASNGRSFTGYWTCADDDEAHDWNESILGGPATTNDVSCAKLRPAPLGGTWFDGNYKLDLCLIGDDEYKNSFILPSRVRGYEEGVQHRNGVIVSGQYTTSAGERGLSLFFHMRDGRLGNFYWSYDDLDQINTREDMFSNLHGFDILTRERDTTIVQCESNEYLLAAQPFLEDDESANASTSLVASLVALFLAVVAFF